ncbi:MAG: outer membrane beta-barrel protein [Deltaproteobacteria bacterium]
MTKVNLWRVLAILIFVAAGLLYTADTSKAQGIGGEFAFALGAQIGPFDTGAGFYIAGEVGLPLVPIGPGILMGIVHIGLARTDDEVSAVSPLVVVGAPAGAVTSTEVDLTNLSVIAGLKYKFLFSNFFQPYIVVAPGFNVLLSSTDGAALGDDFAGGISPLPAELDRRGFPAGQGDVNLGLHTGIGVDMNITPKVFVGAEARYNFISGPNGSFYTFTGRTGFRF